MPMPESVRMLVFMVLFSKPITLATSLRAFLPLDTGVDVLGVLAEDDDVHLLRMHHRRADPGEIADRADAGVQVHHLAQRHVDRAEAAADRRGERPFERDIVLLDGVDRLFRAAIRRTARSLSRRHRHPSRRSSSCRRRLLSTAASTTRRVAFMMSRPMPSPSITGMIGLSGMIIFLFLTVIAEPFGTTICLYFAGMDTPLSTSAPGGALYRSRQTSAERPIHFCLISVRGSSPPLWRQEPPARRCRYP